MKLIPFWLWPMSWGLRGLDRQKAKAKYQLEGESLELRLCEIDFIYSRDLENKKKTELFIRKKYGHLTEEEYDTALLEFDKITDLEKQRKKLFIDFKYGNINEEDYELSLLDLITDPESPPALKL